MNPPRTTVELFDMADKYAAASEVVEWCDAIDRKDKIPQPGLDKSEKKHKKALKSKKNRKPDNKEVLAIPEKFTKGKKDYTGRSKAKAPIDGYTKNTKWCPLHQQAGHDLRTYRGWQKKLEDYYTGKGPLPSIQELGETSSKKDKDGDEEKEYQEPQHTVDMIFEGSSLHESRRHLKAVEREVNLAVVETPITVKPSRWSKTVISFSKEDCPIPSTRPGRFRIVVEPTINNCKVNRDLIDGGRSLNILFAGALEEMQIPKSKVKPVKSTFHGIVPGPTAKLIGQLSLPVTFGRPDNFRTENIPFHVVDFETAYNGIQGRLALAKFLKATYYSY